MKSITDLKKPQGDFKFSFLFGASFLMVLFISIQVLTAQDVAYRDSRVREYLPATRIVWQQGTIENLDHLLKAGNGQADLVGKGLVTLKGDSTKNPAFILDFGKELHGGLKIVSGIFPGKDPIHLKVTLGESVSEAMSTCMMDSSTATNDHAIRELIVPIPWLGSIEVGNSGYRFAKIELLDTDRVLKLKEIHAISIYRDIPYLGAFKSNDDRLNQIWETGAYTVHLNMQEYLWDGIKRDRLVWVGDMHPEVMTIKSVFGYNEVVPKSLDLIKEITELPNWMNGISAYSIWWILIQHEWYNTYGDEKYLRDQEKYIFDLLDLLAKKIDENGSEVLDGGRFLDWPTSPNKEAVHAGLQSLMVWVFETGVELSVILGNAEKEQAYKSVLKLLMNHVPDPNANKSAAALMAISGLRKAKDVNNTWLSQDPLDGVSTFYGYYVLQARAQAGDYTGAMDVIRNYWGAMLDLGATTFWEDFNLEWAKNASRIDELPVTGKQDIHADFGDYCYVGLRHSLCHGWASGPTAWLSEHVLGVTLKEAGEVAVIDPHLGDLQWVEGSYPTKYGVIKVRHERDENGKVKSQVDAPDELSVIMN